MDSDPTPGDIDEMTRVRDRYRDVGDQADIALRFVKKGGLLESGRGEAMEALKKQVGDLPDKLQKTVTSFHDAADAYTQYAPRLVEAQDLLDKAMDQASSVSGQAGQTVPPPAADATDQQKTEAKQQQDKINAAQDQLNAAKSMAQQAKELREQAQRSCADVLDRAAGEAIPERNIFQKISDFFKDFPFVQIILAALIAIVSVFFPVVGVLLGAALFAVTQISAIASGNFKLGDFLVGLVSLVPGGALIGLGGKAVTKLAPGVIAGLKGSGAVKSVSGSITGIKTSIQNSKIVGPVVNSQAAKVAGQTAGRFGEGAGEEAATQVLNGDGIDPSTIALGGAAGVVAGGAILGGKKFAGGGKKTAGAGGPIPIKGTGPAGSGPRTRSTPGESGPAAPVAAPSAVTPPPPAVVTPPPAATPPPAQPDIKPHTVGGPRVRRDKDIPVDAAGNVAPPTPANIAKLNVKGMSTFNTPENAGKAGLHGQVRAPNKPLPEGLGIIADGKDVKGPHAVGHHTIFPTKEMSFEEFENLIKSMNFQNVGKKV